MSYQELKQNTEGGFPNFAKILMAIGFVFCLYYSIRYYKGNEVAIIIFWLVALLPFVVAVVGWIFSHLRDFEERRKKQQEWDRKPIKEKT